MNAEWQNIVALAIVALAVAYLLRPFFVKKRKKAGGCGSGDCGCKKP